MGKTWTKAQGLVIALILVSIASVAIGFVTEFDDDIWLTGDEDAVRWYNGNYYWSIQANSSLASNVELIWPSADADYSGRPLISDGAGGLGWGGPVTISETLQFEDQSAIMGLIWIAGNDDFWFENRTNGADTHIAAGPNGDVLTHSNLLPYLDDDADLGDSSHRWKILYLSTGITDNTNSVSVAELKTAYDHSQDNTQAHSDYLLNNADDTTSGSLTIGGRITITADLDTDLSTVSAWELDGNGDAMPVSGNFHDLHYDLDTNDDLMPAIVFYFEPDAQGDLAPTL